MRTRLVIALLVALLPAIACQAPNAVPSVSNPGGSGDLVAPNAEDPSIGLDPTIAAPSGATLQDPVAPDVELRTPGPDPTLPSG